MNSSSENVSETETKAQGQKLKTSRLAIAAVVLAVVTFCIWLFWVCGTHVYPPGPSRMQSLARNISVLPGLVALILGIVAVLKIRKSRGTLKGLVTAIIGIALSVMFLGVWIPEQTLRDYPSYRRQRMISVSNLSGLGKAMVIYANEHDGKFPTPDKWCDLLLEGDYVRVNEFVRPRLILYRPIVGGHLLVWPPGKRGRCDYAMNPNCEPNSPNDVVLLFETRSGWNQFGGPELLAPENHGGRGCNILFNDGHVDFVETDKLGELKWK